MAYLKTASPGIVVSEVDMTKSGNTVTTGNIAAIAGPFQRGPINLPVLIETESELIGTFGYPTDSNYEYWHCIQRFLNYGGRCYVVRVAEAAARNAVLTGSAIQVKTTLEFNQNRGTYTVGALARTAGVYGNNIGVSVIDHGADQLLTLATTPASAPTVGATLTFNVTPSGTKTALVYSWDSVNKKLAVINVTGGAITTADVLEDGATDVVISTAVDWYSEQVVFENVEWRRLAARPGTSSFVSSRGGSADLFHVVVYDATGGVTGNRYSILETYFNVSKAKGAQTATGDISYFVDVIANQGNWVYLVDTLPVISAGTLNTGKTSLGSTTYSAAFKYITSGSTTLSGGVDDLASTSGGVLAGYDYFDDPEEYTVDFLLMGPGESNVQLSVAKANYVIAKAELRKNSIAFVSPARTSVLNIASSDTVTDNLIVWDASVTGSSYAIKDSGYIEIYDKYRDTRCWIPMNADIAGICSSNPFYVAPAGKVKGQLRGANIRLAYNPTLKSHRDIIYVQSINPVISKNGGIYLYGDKTNLRDDSAFSRINVRRVFIELEKAISASAEAFLWEFNNETTRSLFRNQVEPYLSDLKSLGGIVDYVVQCDASNNPPSVVDNYEFVADIYIRPARPIEAIALNFIASASGIAFTETSTTFKGF